MTEEINPIVPTLQEFEFTLFEISQLASAEVNRIFEMENAKGNVENGYHIKGDSCAHGSTVLYLKKRSLLFKFFNSIPYTVDGFYFISIYDSQVRISLRNINYGQSYDLMRAAYEIVVDQLKKKYNWEIYCNVDLN